MLGNLFGAAGTNFIMDVTGPIAITVFLAGYLVIGVLAVSFGPQEMGV